MRKTTTLLFIALFISVASHAQYSMAKKTEEVNAGVGISSWGVPIYLGYDYSIHKNISIGAEASVRSYNEQWENYRFHHIIYGILANANYHLNSLIFIPKELDLYLGINMGVYVWTNPDRSYEKKVSCIGAGGQVGIRYFTNDNVAFHFEIGGGMAFNAFKLGITYKIFR